MEVEICLFLNFRDSLSRLGDWVLLAFAAQCPLPEPLLRKYLMHCTLIGPKIPILCFLVSALEYTFTSQDYKRA